MPALRAGPLSDDDNDDDDDDDATSTDVSDDDGSGDADDSGDVQLCCVWANDAAIVLLSHPSAVSCWGSLPQLSNDPPLVRTVSDDDALPETWRAMEHALNSGKARAIGAVFPCPSSYLYDAASLPDTSFNRYLCWTLFCFLRACSIHTGVSNFTIAHLKELKKHAKVMPMVNQVLDRHVSHAYDSADHVPL